MMWRSARSPKRLRNPVEADGFEADEATVEAIRQEALQLLADAASAVTQGGEPAA
ncbi:hypothetical protein ACTMU2_31440 [Cupriavidus basilensis]